MVFVTSNSSPTTSTEAQRKAAKDAAKAQEKAAKDAAKAQEKAAKDAAKAEKAARERAAKDKARPADGYERAPASRPGSPSAAALDSFKLINDLGAEARKLKAELAASSANATIDAHSTSEDMSGAQFRLFSRSSRFSSQVLGKAFDHALKNGLGGGADDPRLTPEDRAQLGALGSELKRALLRSKDSYLSAGERHLASQEVADKVITLQELAYRKATDVALDEGKKKLEGAGKLLGGLWDKVRGE